MAQALVNALPQGGDIFMIQGSSSDNNVQMVKQGFDDMLADTDLHVVYEANCDGWTAELAAGYVEEALEKYPHVKGLCAEMMILPVRLYRYWQRISLLEMWLL